MIVFNEGNRKIAIDNNYHQPTGVALPSGCDLILVIFVLLDSLPVERHCSMFVVE
jgi:hypothetical protein